MDPWAQRVQCQLLCWGMPISMELRHSAYQGKYLNHLSLLLLPQFVVIMPTSIVLWNITYIFKMIISKTPFVSGCFFWYRISLCSLSCPETPYVDQAGLEFLAILLLSPSVEIPAIHYHICLSKSLWLEPKVNTELNMLSSFFNEDSRITQQEDPRVDAVHPSPNEHKLLLPSDIVLHGLPLCGSWCRILEMGRTSDMVLFKQKFSKKKTEVSFRMCGCLTQDERETSDSPELGFSPVCFITWSPLLHLSELNSSNVAESRGFCSALYASVNLLIKED